MPGGTATFALRARMVPSISSGNAAAALRSFCAVAEAATPVATSMHSRLIDRSEVVCTWLPRISPDTNPRRLLYTMVTATPALHKPRCPAWPAYLRRLRPVRRARRRRPLNRVPRRACAGPSSPRWSRRAPAPQALISTRAMRYCQKLEEPLPPTNPKHATQLRNTGVSMRLWVAGALVTPTRAANRRSPLCA